jgi:hypothetical protein
MIQWYFLIKIYIIYQIRYLEIQYIHSGSLMIAKLTLSLTLNNHHFKYKILKWGIFKIKFYKLIKILFKIPSRIKLLSNLFKLTSIRI